jgi:metallo-beta-lactamase family protein
VINITCLGAARTVTGSSFLVEIPSGNKVVVDCGLFQGSRDLERRNWEQWGYDPKEIKNVVLTHAHIDHSGRIPKLVKDGFRGSIITSPPTAELCEAMLPDSGHVQEMDAEWQTRKNRRKARRGIEPLYTTEDAQESLRYFVAIDYDRFFDLEAGIKGRFRNAGHILGSSILELWVEDEGHQTKIVFSGDLGKQDPLIVEEPFVISEADYLFVESTYGNRLHRDFEQSKAELLEAIRYAVAHKEKVIIPAFAVERTQEVLYVLGEFFRARQLPDIPVYLDSPLAIRATQIFRKYKKYYDEKARAILAQGVDPLDMPNLKLSHTTKESMEINQLQGPAIVISANGMCTAGRIKHHLKHNLWRPGAVIVIIGFQAEGTTGRRIVEGAEAVTIFGERVAVRAKVYTIGGFSAHADQADLLTWVGHLAKKSVPRVFLIHGEPKSTETLATVMRQRLRLDVYVPQWREVLKLDTRKGLATIVPEPVPEDPRQIMLSLAGELEAQVLRLKEQLSDAEKPVSYDVAKLRSLRDEIKALTLQ